MRHRSRNSAPVQELRSTDTSRRGRCQTLKEHVQQEKRPRHECTAKILSAHRFWRHALAEPACRWVDKYFEGLNFLCAGYP
jgi:hypothetical protein